MRELPRHQHDEDHEEPWDDDMTLIELKSMINDTSWFKRLAVHEDGELLFQIASLKPWAGERTDDERFERIADLMDWLPSSREQDDPIHGRSLDELAEKIGVRKEISQKCAEIFKEALIGLGKFQGHPILRVGPHDFAGAAKGAALYACRRATYEVFLDQTGFWCRVMHLYHIGHWPCGIMPNGRVVVL